jgi:hypothetical protein
MLTWERERARGRHQMRVRERARERALVFDAHLGEGEKEGRTRGVRVRD